MNKRLPLQAASSLLGAFVFALIVTSGSSLWIPPGRAGIDHIVVPLVVFPVVWVSLTVALYAARRRGRAWAIAGGLAALHMLLIVVHRLVG